MKSTSTNRCIGSSVAHQRRRRSPCAPCIDEPSRASVDHMGVHTRSSLSVEIAASPSTPREIMHASPSMPPLLRLARERSTFSGVPKPLARPFEKSSVPAIPSVDKAWGYEEGASGDLELQQPLVPPTSVRAGPGEYTPV